MSLLPAQLRSRLKITQQCRPEDLDRVAEAYRQAKVNVELQSFFTDLPERMADSHLVISRSGASTVAELCVIGRPAILIPLPGAIDADQKAGAGKGSLRTAGWTEGETFRGVDQTLLHGAGFGVEADSQAWVVFVYMAGLDLVCGRW